MPGPLRSGGKLVLVAPGTGEIILSDEATAAQQLGQGYQPATVEDVERHNTREQYGTIGQQALAQAERAVRTATLGQVEGIGDEEAIRARAELSEEEHPVLSFAASVAPDVALGLATGGVSALGTTAGRVAAREAGALALKEGASLGLRGTLAAAAKAAPRAALIGETVMGGASAAAQEAFSEGRQFLRDDPMEDAYNTLFWTGLGGAIAGAPAAFRAVRGGLGKAGRVAARAADEAELTAAREGAERAELGAVEPGALPEQAGARTRGAPTTSDEGTLEAYAQAGEEIPPPSLRPGAPEAAVAPEATGLDMAAEGAAPEAAAGKAAGKAAPEVEQATPLDSYLASFGQADRQAIEDEVEQEILERFDELGKKVPQPGSKRWQAVEDEIALRRIQEAGGSFEQAAPGLGAEALPGATAGEVGARKGLGEAEQRAAEQAADRGVAKAERNALRSEAEDMLQKVTRGESPLEQGGGWLEDSRLARYRPEIIDVATKEMRQDLNELNKLSQGIRERAVKQEDVAKNISDNLLGQQAKARDIALAGSRLAGTIQADAKRLAAQMGKNRPQYFSGTARDLVTSLIERTKTIAKLTDGAEIFNQLDDLKRVSDNFKVALEQGGRTSAKDPLLYQQLIPRVEEFANQIRAGLEDRAVFGRAGEMQQAYNATYHGKWFPAKQVFEDSVFKVTGRDYKAFSTLDAWESKITSLLEKGGTGERRHVGDMLDALQEMAEQRAKYGTASAKETGRIVELTQKIRRTFDLADRTTAAQRRMQDVSTVGTALGGALGGIVGGVPGAIIGGGLARGVGEFATGRFRTALSNLRSATESATERSVDDWIAASQRRAGVKLPGVQRATRLSLEDQHLLDVAKRRGTTLGFSEFLGDDDNPQSAFEQKRLALQDDEAFFDRFSEEYGDLASSHPQAYALAAAKAAEVRQFLTARLPANMAISMTKPKGYPPTNESIEDWSVYYNAATNPRSIYRSLAQGDIRVQEIETLRTLYPRQYEDLQNTMVTKITTATQQGAELDDQFLMRMNLLFDLDGAGTPAFSQRAAAVARNYEDPTLKAPKQKPFAPDAGSRISPSNVAQTGPTYGAMG